jgi:hypothetical protein
MKTKILLSAVESLLLLTVMTVTTLAVEVDAKRQQYEIHSKPPPTGACCDNTTGDCRVTTEVLCSGPYDEYQGDWTDCDPNPCGPPNPCSLTCVEL